LSTTLFNDGFNVGVELDKVVNLTLDTLLSSGVTVEVGSFAEEFSAETFLGVNEDSVLVAV
jgi:hypothetical protein